MKNFSKFEENETKLDAIKGGKKVVDQEFSGSQGNITESVIVYDDGSWEPTYDC